MRELITNAREAAALNRLPFRVNVDLSMSEPDAIGQRWAIVKIEDKSGGIPLHIRAG